MEYFLGALQNIIIIELMVGSTDTFPVYRGIVKPNHDSSDPLFINKNTKKHIKTKLTYCQH